MPVASIRTTNVENQTLDLEFETLGSSSDPAILLVMGFSAQLTVWPDGFCQSLADQGRYVIRFDNRDCGLSTKLDGVSVDVGAVLTAAMMNDPSLLPPVPYTLSDMGNDAIGLLDYLGLSKAHIVGASMGGMIVQTMAIEHPSRIHSMTSIMSTTGEFEVSQPSPEAGAALLAPPPTERDAYIANSTTSLVWQSKKYRNAQETMDNAARDFDRSFYPEGSTRQLAAIYASGSRAELLVNVDVPTLVIHGRDDTLLPPAGGLRTAELVPGAHLLLMADMGHDLPAPLWPTVVDAIISHTSKG